MKTHVGPYRIEEMLGRGGMGVVYRGMHEHLGRQVAIKELAPELTQQPEFKERFFAEARTQARLHHPNIVTVFDLIEEKNDFFIVMEYVAGRACDDLLKESAGRGLPLGEAVGIFSQVLSALDYAHSEGVIHRDVKPSNVLLTGDGRVKLMDFGIALLVGDKRLTSSQSSIGTPIYMSPEQILRPREMDHRTDIYSAAIVFFEMLAGRPPFDAESVYEINKLQIESPPPDLTDRNPEVPAAVAAVITRALAKSPDGRFMSAGEMLRALREAMPNAAGSSLPPPAPLFTPPKTTSALRPFPTAAVGSPPPVVRSGKRGPWPFLAAGVAAAILVAVVLGVTLKSSPSPVPVAASGTTEGAAPGEVKPAGTAGAPLAPVERTPRIIPASSSPAGVPELKAVGSNAPTPVRPAAVPGESRQRPAPTPPPVDGRAIDQETRRREVARVREAIQHGIDAVRADLAAQRFSSAREQLSQLEETAIPYRADLIDEVANLRALDQEITSKQISAKTAALTRQQEEAGLQQRLQEIRGLIQDKHYPEAKMLANKLAGESGVPEGVAAEARDLFAKADQEMKVIFNKTTVRTDDKLLKKPPR